MPPSRLLLLLFCFVSCSQNKGMACHGERTVSANERLRALDLPLRLAHTVNNSLSLSLFCFSLNSNPHLIHLLPQDIELI